MIKLDFDLPYGVNLNLSLSMNLSALTLFIERSYCLRLLGTVGGLFDRFLAGDIWLSAYDN